MSCCSFDLASRTSFSLFIFSAYSVIFDESNYFIALRYSFYISSSSTSFSSPELFKLGMTTPLNVEMVFMTFTGLILTGMRADF